MNLARSFRVLSAALLLLPSLLRAQGAGTAPDPTVTLLPGDAIRLTVWRMEDMTGEFLVDENGMATLPLLGPIRVTGMPIGQVKETLYAQFREQLNNPSIEITPLRRVYVLGEVKEPGLYAVDPTVSLAGAIALAQGPTENGSLGNVRVIRGTQTIREQVEIGASLANVDIRSGDQILIGQKSWLTRNSTFVANLLVSFTLTAITVLTR